MKGLSFAGEMITYTNTAHRRAFTNQPRDFMSGKDNGTVFFGIQHVCCGQTKWINGAIRNFHRANQCRVNGRFDNARLLRVYSFCADPASSQARIKWLWNERSSSGRVINRPLVGSTQ